MARRSNQEYLKLLNETDTEKVAREYQAAIQKSKSTNRGSGIASPSLPTVGSALSNYVADNNTFNIDNEYKRNNVQKINDTALADRLMFTGQSGQQVSLPGYDFLFENKEPLLPEAPAQTDTSLLGRLGNAGKSIIGNLATAVTMIPEAAKQSYMNYQSNLEDEYYQQWNNKVNDLQGQIDELRNNGGVTLEQIAELNDFTVHGPRYREVYTPELQALYDQLEEAKSVRDVFAADTPIDPNSLAMKVYRQAQADRVAAVEGLSPGMQFVGNTLMSIGDNLVTLPFAAVNPAIPLAMMGASSTGQTIGELSERGIDANEALMRGALSGGIEAATEKMGLDNLLDLAGNTVKPTLREFGQNVLQQATTEGLEEGLSYLGNTAVDYAYQDPEANFDPKELLLSMAGGALSGGIMGTGGQLVGSVINSSQNQNVETQDTFDDAVEKSTSKIKNSQLKENAKKVINVLKDKVFKNGKILTFKEQLNDPESVSLTTQPYLVKDAFINMPIEALNNKPVVINQRNLDKSITTHKIEKNTLENLDKLLEDPIAIIQSYSTDADGNSLDAYMVFTKAKDYRDKYIQAVIYPNSTFDSNNLVVDSIASVYGRDLENTISNAQKNNKYVWTKKDATPIGLQLPKGSISTESVNQKDESVNGMSNKSHKLLNAESKAFSDLSRYIQNEFGLSKSEVDAEFRPAIMQLKEQIQSNGRIDTNLANSIFEGLWNAGQRTDTTLSDQYSDLANRLKILNLDKDTAKKALGNFWNDYQNQSKRLVSLKKNGNSIDQTYQELMSEYPEFFDEQLNTEDQLNAILDVATKLQPRSRSISSTDQPFKAEYVQAFHNNLNKYLDTLETTQMIYEENLKAKDRNKVDQESLSNMNVNINDLQRQYDAVVRSTLYTPKEMNAVDDIINGRYTADQVSKMDDIRMEVVNQLLGAKEPLVKAKKVQKEYKKMIRAERLQKASDYISGMFAWKDKRSGILYNTETAERNIRDVMGHTPEAEALIDAFFTPVHEKEAQATIFKNEYRQRVKNLNLTKLESEYVQRLGEGDIDIQKVAEAGLDPMKIQNAVNEFRAIYDELLNQANAVLVANGYDPVERRENYFPHIVEEKNTGVLSQIKEKVFGITGKQKLDTSIAGITDTFKPGKQYFSNFNRRYTTQTEYDAVKGFDNYIDGIANVIFQTENIQNLRALEYQIRYENSDEYIQEQIDKINEDMDLDENERYQKIDDLLEKRQATRNFGNLVTWLRNYTNNLAGKKSFEDRSWEYNLGREMYAASKNLSSRVAANMVAVNPASWATNFIPITQASAECSHFNIGKAMIETVTNDIKSDNITDDSSFLTNRKGSDKLVKTFFQGLADFSSKPMQMIDNFTSEVVWRAKYHEDIDSGMSHDDAVKDADKYAASLIADRSKGAMPLAFEIKNPIAKIFTQFQLEQNNQLRYLFKDLPHAQQEKAFMYTFMGVAKLSLDALAFNLLYEMFFGRKPAFDIIDMGFSTLDVLNDPDLKNSEKLGTIATDLAGELPFVGNIVDGGRLPITSAFPSNPFELANLIDDEVSDEKKMDTVYDQLLKPLSYVVLPFGASQLNKSLSGLTEYSQGASYNYYDDGDRLKYVVDQNPANFFRALIAGPSSFPESREYWDNNGKMLSTKDTDTFQVLNDSYDNKTALEKLYELKAIESTKDQNDNSIDDSSSLNKKNYIDSLDIPYYYKLQLYDQYGVSDKVQNMSKEELNELEKKIQEKAKK